MKNYKRYLILWASQSLSQFGGSMTAFALTLWAYSQTGSALTISLMSFCIYVPYILVSLFAGSFVDRHNKKAIMLISDTAAAICTLGVLLLGDKLQIWHIYIVDAVVGCGNAFQQPASSVAVGQLVPREKLTQVSGLNSFSSNLTMVFSPMLAAALYGIAGLKLILMIDLLSFSVAFLVLLLAIRLPKQATETTKDSAFAGIGEGFAFLRKEKGLLMVMLTMAAINFFSRLTYENILSPMILERSGNDAFALSTVNAAMGIGGIVGGILVSAMKPAKKNARMMYTAAALSFLFGDVTMALGNSTVLWCLAGVAASLPIPFIMAGNNVLMYNKVPDEMQGRVFAVRNAIQFGTVPIGILLGGFLADQVFEPMFAAPGQGMAMMFLCTGILGCGMSLASLHNRHIQKLEE